MEVSASHEAPTRQTLAQGHALRLHRRAVRLRAEHAAAGGARGHAPLRYARGGAPRQTIDYSRLLGELRFILTATRFRLLESAAEAVAAWCLAAPSADAPRPQVEEVDVCLSKLVALSGAAVPTLEIHRDRSDFPLRVEPKSFGFVDVIFETRECGVYRERISPKTVLPTHVHQQLDESELVLGSGFLLQGKPVEAGVAHTWPRGFPHRYDETEVDVPVAQLTRPEPVRFF